MSKRSGLGVLGPLGGEILGLVAPATTSALLVALVSCGGAKQPTSAAPNIAHAIAATLNAAEHTRAPWRCVADDLPELAPGTVGKWQLAAHSLTHAAAPQLVIGVVADAGGADPKTLAALGRMRAKLDEAQVELVLVLGGMGTTQPELEATLGVLAKPGSPVVALPGDLEAVGAETAQPGRRRPARALDRAARCDDRNGRWRR